MGKSVDDEIVRMQFDNAQFERGARESLNTIDKLKQSLNFKDKGLDNLSKSVENVKVDFSALQVVAVTALSRITNAAMNAGNKLVKAFTLEPVLSGFQEYETQINAVQTILANTSSKGTTLDQVNDALDELNKYADQTIYNFTQMTRNIGTFTAAGVDLNTSVQAIKGIANLAAVSGSTSQQASTAMYQLSQALAAGTVKLMDWNSVVNAGMGGQVFQDALKETARVHGIQIDAMIKKEGSFRETLKEGWLSASVLTETLAKFTGDLSEAELKAIGYTDQQIASIMEMGKTANDAATKVKTFTQLMDTLKEAAQSGWTQTWEILIGDFEEAKELLTGISNVVSDFLNKQSDARNEMLQTWKDFGGRTDLLEAFANVLKGIYSFIKPISEAFREIFPPTTSAQLMRLTKQFLVFSRTFGLLDYQADQVRDAFRGLFQMMKIVGAVMLEIAKGSFLVLYNIGDLYDDLLFSLIGLFGRFIFKLIDVEDVASGVSKVFNVVNSVLRDLNERIDAVASDERLIAFVDNLAESIKDFAATAKIDFFAVVGIIKDFIDRLRSMESFNIFDIFGALKQFIKDIQAYFASADRSFNLFSNALKSLEELVRGIFEKLGLDFDKVKSTIGGFFDFIQKKAESVNFGKVLAAAVGAGSLVLLYKLAKQLMVLNRLYSALTGVVETASKTLKAASGALKAYQKEKNAKSILVFAGAIAILAGSIALLAQLDIKQVAAAAAVIVGLSVSMAVVSKMMTKFDGLDQISGFLKMGAGLVLFAGTIMILVKAFEELNSIDVENAAKKVSVIVIMGGLIAGFAQLMNKNKVNMAGVGLYFISFASAVKILIGTLDDISELDFADLAKSIPALLATMYGIAMVAKVAFSMTSKTKSGGIASKTKAGIDAFGILAIVLSIKMLVGVIKDLSKENPADIVAGLVDFIAVFYTVNLMLRATNKAGTNAAKAGVAVLAMSVAIRVIAKGIQDLADLNSATVAKAGKTIKGILLVFTLITGMTKFAGPNGAKAGLAILQMSLAIDLLVPAIWALGSMDPEKVQRGVGAISQVMLAFGVMVILTRFAGQAKSLRTTIQSLTVSVVALGAVITVLSLLDPSGLSRATVAIDSVILCFSALVAATHLMTNTKVTIILLGTVIVALGAVLYALASLPIDGAQSAASALSVLILSVSGAVLLLSNFPKEASLLGILKSLGIVALILGAVGAVVAGIGYLNDNGRLGDVVNKSIPVLEGLADAIGGFIGHLIGSFASGVISGALDVLPAMGNAFSGFITAFKPSIDMLTQIPNGVGSNAEAMGSAILAIASAAWKLTKTDIFSAFTGGVDWESFSNGMAVLGTGVRNFVDNAGDIDSKRVSGALDCIRQLSAISQDIPNTGGLIAKIVGDNTIDVWGEQLALFGASLRTFADTIGGDFPQKAVEGAADAAKMLADFSNNVPESGGALQKWIGEKNMQTFGVQLEAFGRSLKNFAATIGNDFPKGAVEGAANAALALTKFNENIPESGGAIQRFFGEKDMTKFGADLETFGMYLKKFAVWVQFIKPETTDGAISVGNALVALSNSLEESGGMFEFMTGKKDLTTFGNQLEGFGMSLYNFYSQTREIGVERISSVTGAIESIVELCKSVSVLERNDLYNFGVAIKTLAKDAVKDFVDSVNSTEVVKSVENAGKYVVQGFVRGIRANIRDVTDAGNAMGDAVEVGVRKRLKIESPSKVLKALGAFAGDGLLVGLTKKIPEIGDAGSDAGEAVLNKISESLGMNADGTGASQALTNIGSGSVSSLAKGIRSNKSAEEAAEEKANAIINKFQAVFDKLDISINTIDLEQQLYDAMYANVEGIDVTKQAKAIEAASRTLELQNERLANAELEYAEMVKTFGEGSQQAQESYNRMLQEAINVQTATNDLLEKQKELAEIQKNTAGTNTVVKQAQLYEQYLKENLAALQQYGYTYEELEADARKRSGFNPDKLRAEANKLKNASVEGASAAVDETGKVAEVIKQDVEPKMLEAGAAVGEAYVNGMESNAEAVNQTGSDTAIEGINGAESEKPGFSQAGINATDAYIDGMRSNIERVSQTAAEIAKNAYQSAMDAINGGGADKTLESIKKAAAIAGGGGGGGDDSDSISAVVDMAHAAYKSELERNIGIASSMSKKEIDDLVKHYEQTTGEKISQEALSGKNQSITVGSIIQNNYSSRELDRDGVYRDTKSLFANVGGTVESAAKDASGGSKSGKSK